MHITISTGAGKDRIYKSHILSEEAAKRMDMSKHIALLIEAIRKEEKEQAKLKAKEEEGKQNGTDDSTGANGP